MTQQQWDQHMEHFDEHITWPATKQEILDACQGTDVEPSVLDEIRTTLMNGGKTYAKEEVKDMLVTTL